MIKLSIVLPVHNEAGGIEAYCKQIIEIMSKSPVSYEILCIENGSTDDSLAILKKLAKKYIVLKVHQSGKGWGTAVQKGIDMARGKYFCYLVSDGQIDPTIIPRLFKLIEKSEYGMVKISRSSRENMKRLMNSRAYNMVASTIFQLPTKDVNGTPKILETSLVRRMKLESHNIAIDLELMIKLKMNNIHWKELSVESKNRESGSSSTNIKSAIEMVKYIFDFQKKKAGWRDLV